jgi:hypothetical protein
MKDLSDYIESLLDVIKNPCVVKYKDDIYYVDIVHDFKNDYNRYVISDPYLIHLLTETESMLKTYLPTIKVNVGIKKINVPIQFQNTYVDVTSRQEINYNPSYVVDHWPMTYIDNTN